MQQTISNIEYIFGGFSPLFILSVSLFFTLSGLIIWLGGLQFRRFTAFFLVLLTSYSVLSPAFKDSAAAVISLVAAAAGAAVSKPAVILLGIVIICCVFLFFTADPFANSSFIPGRITADSYAQGPRLSVRQSMTELDYLVKFAVSCAADAFKKLSPAQFLAAAVISALVAASGLLLPKLTAAAVFSFCGTFLVFAGMTGLLLFKGSHPLAGMQNSKSFFMTAFYVMVCFGTAAELLLCPPKQKKPEHNSEK